MSKGDRDPQREARGEERPPQRTAAEWTIFAASAVLIVAVVAVLVADLLGPSTPPAFETRVEAVRDRGGSYQVPVRVENVGGQAAAKVRVDAELELGGEVNEADEMIDFLAAGEDRAVTFVFDRDPRRGRLSVSVSGFQEP